MLPAKYLLAHLAGARKRRGYLARLIAPVACSRTELARVLFAVVHECPAAILTVAPMPPVLAQHAHRIPVYRHVPPGIFSLSGNCERPRTFHAAETAPHGKFLRASATGTILGWYRIFALTRIPGWTLCPEAMKTLAYDKFRFMV